MGWRKKGGSSQASCALTASFKQGVRGEATCSFNANKGNFELDNGAKVSEKVEESFDKYNQVPNNKDDAESQVPNNKSHVSWGLLQHMYYLLLFG